MRNSEHKTSSVQKDRHPGRWLLAGIFGLLAVFGGAVLLLAAEDLSRQEDAY